MSIFVLIRSTPPNAQLGMDELLLQTLRDSAQYEPYLRPNFPSRPEVVNVTMQLVTIENLDLSQSVSSFIDSFNTTYITFIFHKTS